MLGLDADSKIKSKTSTILFSRDDLPLSKRLKFTMPHYIVFSLFQFGLTILFLLIDLLAFLICIIVSHSHKYSLFIFITSNIFYLIMPICQSFYNHSLRCLIHHHNCNLVYMHKVHCLHVRIFFIH